MFLFLSVWLSSVVQAGNYPNDVGRVDSGYPFFVMCRKKRHGRNIGFHLKVSIFVTSFASSLVECRFTCHKKCHTKSQNICRKGTNRSKGKVTCPYTKVTSLGRLFELVQQLFNKTAF